MANKLARNVAREQASRNRIAFMVGTRELRQQINNPSYSDMQGESIKKPLLVILKQGGKER